MVMMSTLTRRGMASLTIAAALASLAIAVVVALAAPSSALAYDRDWTCKPANDTWCYDPEGLSDWREGEVKLEKGYNAYLCVGIFKEGWNADVCTESRVADGTTLTWKWGTEFSGEDPLHGAGLQDNAQGNAQEIWCWFWEP